MAIQSRNRTMVMTGHTHRHFNGMCLNLKMVNSFNTFISCNGRSVINSFIIQAMIHCKKKKKIETIKPNTNTGSM